MRNEHAVDSRIDWRVGTGAPKLLTHVVPRPPPVEGTAIGPAG